jgi:hypothetical protein
MQLIRVGLLSVICATSIRTVKAQDAFQERGADNASTSNSANAGTTEESDFSQGGFFGLGAQKPMKRVRGINLPEQQVRSGFSNAQQAHSQTSPVEFMQTRKFSKPETGAPTTDFPARVIYLNGRNVSSVRDQTLEGVNVSIDSHGNIHIIAPHYEVQESTHYRPLFGKDVPRFSKPVPSGANLSNPNSIPEVAPAPTQPDGAVVPPISAEETSKVQ